MLRGMRRAVRLAGSLPKNLRSSPSRHCNRVPAALHARSVPTATLRVQHYSTPAVQYEQSDLTPSRSGLPLPAASLAPADEHEHASSGSSPDSRPQHAVISTFDLFSIGVGPSSSHTVGPMRAGRIFLHSLPSSMYPHIHSLKISLHGSLAATGMGHMTPHATLLGLMGEDPETVPVGRLERVMDEVRAAKGFELGLPKVNASEGAEGVRVRFDLDRDLSWHLPPLPAHPNGLRFSLFNTEGDLLATNEYFSVGGGFVVNSATQVAENLYYMGVDKEVVEASRRDMASSTSHSTSSAPDSGHRAILPSPIGNSEESSGQSTQADAQSEAPSKAAEGSSELSGQPRFLFATAEELHKICVDNDMTIAQVIWENERAFRSEDEIREGLLRLWDVMDSSIRTGVTSPEPLLPGEFKVRRRAPGLYRRLQRGFYPTNELGGGGGGGGGGGAGSYGNGNGNGTGNGNGNGNGKSTSLDLAKRIGRRDHAIQPVPHRSTPVFPGIEYLSCMAIAVNEVNASGGRVVTAPTNGAAGVIPATLKYVTEFISHSAERDIMTFLLTASAIGMLFKRGATISAAEGGCMAEVGVACSMSAAAISACLGAEPAVILQAAEIGIEHNLGLTCDPLGGLVQIPCIERNSLGAVKAVTAAQLAMAGEGQHTVSLDDAIEACRTTALDMHSHYKETSLAGLATTVKIPLSSPAC